VADKYYIELVDGDFVTVAQTPTLAIVNLWNKALEGPFDEHKPPPEIQGRYTIHRGVAADWVSVSAAPALFHFSRDCWQLIRTAVAINDAGCYPSFVELIIEIQDATEQDDAKN